MPPQPYTNWIFCDESGNLSTRETRYLMGVAVSTRSPEILRKAVIRTRQVNRLPRGKALHATDLGSEIVIDFLKRIVQIKDLILSVAILDKQWIWNRQAGYDHLYNQLFAYLIRKSISIQTDSIAHPLIVLERRKKYHSNLVADIIQATSLKESQIQLCTKDDRNWGQQLQIADSIAWSTYQKFEKQDKQFFELFKEKVRLEMILGVDGRGVMRPVSEMNN